MLNYTPKKNRAAAWAVLIPLLLLSAALFPLIVFRPENKRLYGFLLLLFVLAILQITARYFFAVYRYYLDNELFAVICRQGKKETVVCRFCPDDIVAFFPGTEFSKKKKSIGKLDGIYNYCRNFLPDDKSVYYCIFELYDLRSAILLEPGEQITRQILAILARKENR